MVTTGSKIPILDDDSSGESRDETDRAAHHDRCDHAIDSIRQHGGEDRMRENIDPERRPDRQTDTADEDDAGSAAIRTPPLYQGKYCHGEYGDRADDIDPEYGRLLREVVAAGVEPLAYRTTVNPSEARVGVRIPVVLD